MEEITKYEKGMFMVSRFKGSYVGTGTGSKFTCKIMSKGNTGRQIRWRSVEVSAKINAAVDSLCQDQSLSSACNYFTTHVPKRALHSVF